MRIQTSPSRRKSRRFNAYVRCGVYNAHLFIVTATFIKETGVEVNRPDTQTAELKKTVSLLVGVGSDSGIWIDKKKVDVRNVRPLMERLHAENPKGGLVIQADSISKVEKVLAIMDSARQIGITQVAIASEEP